jgi:ribosomal protein RSM22 (predicted rRNA methylase)
VNEARLISCLKEISQNFTSNRKNIADYRLDPEMVEAYSTFYLPTNIPKFAFVLNRLALDMRSRVLAADFYDVGSGPGTYSIAYLENGGSGNVFAIDNAPLMLKQMGQELKSRNFGAEVNILANIKFSIMQIDKTKDRCLFFGNSFNEMSEYEFESYLEKVDPDILFFIEPGTSEVFSKLKKWREHFIEKKWSIAYPCPNNLKCPMPEGDWCHQIVRFTHEPEIERLAQLIKLDRHQMPMCAHVYVKQKTIQAEGSARIVRFLAENKFAFEYQVCFENKLLKFEFQKKKMSKDEVKQMAQVCVGDQLAFKIDKIVNPEWYRVILIS